MFKLNAKSDTDKRNYFTNVFRKFRLKHGIDNEFKIYTLRYHYITKGYLSLRKTLNKDDSIKELSLITGHTSNAILKYIQVNDIELPKDYSKLLK